jgi:hypothetical protein
MAKLHEILAVDRETKNQADKVLGELKDTFEKKRHLFEGKIVTFQPKAEASQAKVEEQRSVQTKVSSELNWIRDFLVKAVDIGNQVAAANQGAAADIRIGTRTLANNVPATMLLELEKRLEQWKQLAESVPTLDPTKNFSIEPSSQTYRAQDVSKTRTQKIQKPIVLYEATKEHPAQVQLASYDEPVGELITQEWSGLMTPANKAGILTNIEILIRAVKKARARANEIEAPKVPIGRVLFDYAFNTQIGEAEVED